MEKLKSQDHIFKEIVKRSIVKTVSYRLIIIFLDFITLYLFTDQIKIAIGYAIVSNSYTIIGYFLHERIWDHILWGKIIYKREQS